MAHSKAQQVKELREKVYFLFSGQAGPQTWGLHDALSDKFDQDLLNDIARLQVVQDDELSELIALVRGKIAICVSTGLIGKGDEEPLNQLLDDIEQKT